MLQGKKPARLFPSQRRVAPNAKRRVPLVDLRSDLVLLGGCEEIPTSLQSSFFPRTPSHAPRAVTPKECTIEARLPSAVHPPPSRFFGSLPGASRLTSFPGVRQRGGGDIGRALPTNESLVHGSAAGTCPDGAATARYAHRGRPAGSGPGPLMNSGHSFINPLTMLCKSSTPTGLCRRRARPCRRQSRVF